jgi:uncharacterized membrane protein
LQTEKGISIPVGNGSVDSSIRRIIHYFCIENPIFTLIIIAFIIYVAYVMRMCEKAQKLIDNYPSADEMLIKILSKIMSEAQGSCWSSIIATVFAIMSLVLLPLIISPQNTPETNDSGSVFWFILGMLISFAQVASILKTSKFVVEDPRLQPVKQSGYQPGNSSQN